MNLNPFEFDPRTRVVFGAGSICRLGEFVSEFGGTRVLLVTDSGLRQAGHEARAIEAIEASGAAVALFDEVNPNPTTQDVDRALEVARAANVDLIVGLGGGSSMDCAKGVNFLLTNGGRMEDYWGVGKASRPMLPMIAVPTTAGTGSEAQSFALIANAETHMKMACGDKKAACRVAILDPELTLSMPASVTAITGIDAISHAVETYVTQPRNPMSQLFSREAWRQLAFGFPRVLKDPQDLDARSAMLLGAHLAGAAIENSMLGAAHSLANPLSAHFDTTHGVAVGVMLPYVVRFNAVTMEAEYAELARAASLPAHSSAALADFLTDLVRDSGTPTRLRECGVDKELIPTLADEAARQWTANFNPRPVDAGQLAAIYEQAY